MDETKLEGLYLLSGPYKGDDDTDLLIAIPRTPLTNCHKKMLDNLEKKLPKGTKNHGLITSRVVMKSGGEEMYFISPIKTNMWEPYVDAIKYFGHNKKDLSEHMLEEIGSLHADDMIKLFWTKAPKQYPPTRMCDVD